MTVVNTAFPDVARDFSGASLSELSWIVNAYTIPFAALLLPAGRIADLAGRRRVFVAGVVLFTIASAAAALAPSLGTLIAARAVQGAAAAAVVPTSLALLLPEFEISRQPVAIGIWGATNSLAAALGPALGGALVEISDWRLVFLVNIPVGVLTVALTLRSVAERRDARARSLPDLAGTAALAAGIALLVLAIVEGNEWGWTSAATLVVAGTGIALAGVALARSFRHTVPAIETSLWRIPGIAAANLSSLLAGVAFFAFILGGSLFLVTQWRYSVLEAGLAMTLGALASGVAAPASGVIASKRGDAPVIVAGALMFAAACVWIAWELPADPSFVSFWLPTSMLVGGGVGLMFPGLASAGVKGVEPQRLGAAIALNMTARQIGGALGVAGLIALLAGSEPGVDTYSTAWALCGVVGALIATVTVVSSARRRRAAAFELTAAEPVVTDEPVPARSAA